MRIENISVLGIPFPPWGTINGVSEGVWDNLYRVYEGSPRIILPDVLVALI